MLTVTRRQAALVTRVRNKGVKRLAGFLVSRMQTHTQREGKSGSKKEV